MNNQNNVEKIQPTGIFTNYIFKAIPLAFDESMSYYETLCNVLDQLKTQNEVINNNADVVQELEDFVSNYFDNLDVQEEINNKLDEMVEDGTLESIIKNYLDLQITYTFNNVNDMKLSDSLVNGTFAKTSGFYSYNDGGGAFYKIRNIVDNEIPNEITIFSLKNENIVAELIQNTNNVLQYGLINDGETDNYDKLITLLSLDINNLYFPSGNYLINTLIQNSIINFKGDGINQTTITCPNGFFKFTSKNNLNICDIKFDGVTKNNNTFLEGLINFSKLNNLYITNFENGLKLSNNSYVNMFENIRFQSLTNCLITGTAFNNNDFINCYFLNNTGLVLDFDGTNVNFNCCNFEGNNNCYDRIRENVVFNNCYFEGNTSIFDINDNYGHNGNNLYCLNCRMLGNSDGWLLKIPLKGNTTASGNVTIQNCDIQNSTIGLKPIYLKSHLTNNDTYISVSLINNKYSKIHENDSTTIYYDDLIDKTNCQSFGNNNNGSGNFITNLPVVKIDDIVFFKLNSNNKSYINNSNINKIMGIISSPTLESGSTTLSVSIPAAKRYCLSKSSTNFISRQICYVIYSDDTKTINTFTITATNISIYSLDNTKTITQINFNSEYFINPTF